MVLVPGDRFVARLLSPAITVGGGEVIDAFPPAKADFERAARVAGLTPKAKLAAFVAESSTGASAHDFAVRCGTDVSDVLGNLSPTILRLQGAEPWLLHRPSAEARVARWRAALAQFHRDHPLLPGIRKEEWRSRELPDVPPFVFEAMLALDSGIAVTADVLHLRTHRLALKQDEERALASIEEAFRSAGLAVPDLSSVLNRSGVDSARARSLLAILLRTGRLRKVTDDLVYHPEAIESVRRLLDSRRGQSFSVGEFKDWTGISRKWAIPLLEFLDRERVTLREGDRRRIL
jgi:selenocysteine-specific elongation factor